MDQEKYIYLIYQKLQSSLSPSEEEELNDWLERSPENKKIQESIVHTLELLDDYEPDFHIDLDSDYIKIKKELGLPLDNQTKQPESKILTLTPLRKLLAIAATITLILSITFFYYYTLPPALEWIVLETKAGEIQNVSLADGSKVWLNENSRFSYPKAFSNEERPVQLDGEAFFDITKNPKQIFQISTSVSTVEVLGTSFNVRAYLNEPFTSVTVKTGKVKFSEKAKGKSVILNPNQEAVLHHGSKEFVKNDDANLNALAWQSNQLSFNNTPLTEVFKIMEKHFKVKIICENPKLKDCHYSMTIQKVGLESLFEILKKLYQIQIIQDNNDRYIIKGGNC